MTFHVGQKVVCVDVDTVSPAGGRGWLPSEKPKLNAVYTVIGVRMLLCNRVVLDLAEIKRDPESMRQWGGDAGYGAWRFRPIVSRKTDISIFTAMLNPSQVTVDALNTADFVRQSAG